MNIDKHLQGILTKLILDSMNASSSADINPVEAIAAIHKAFQDADYRDTSSGSQAVKYGGYMSGQTWLERFTKEMATEFSSFREGANALIESKYVLRAAKRASQSEHSD